MYTKEDFKNAPTMEKKHYLTLQNPKFEGQTGANKDGNYKMYFSDNGNLYCYEHNLYS